MDLDRHVADLRAQLAAAAEPAGEEARAVAERLSVALDAAARLALLEALSEAASEITRDLAPGSVDLRLRGRDPSFVVTPPVAGGVADEPGPETAAAVADPEPDARPAEDGATSRTTLRLPDHLKARAERAAADDGVSLNTWLVRAIADAVDPARRPEAAAPPRAGGARFTGWVS